MKNYLKYKLYNIFSSPLFYICAIIFNIFVPLQFFFVQQFFGGKGTTDLHYFFYAIPLISTILIPLLKLNENFSTFDEAVPLTTEKKLLTSYIALFLQFAFILFPQIFVPLCVNFFGNVEIGQVFTGFFMILLYGAICSSLCVFISSICKNGAVSVIISILILVILNGMNLFSVYVGNNAFFTGIIKTFSFFWHFDAAEKGIFDTRDFFYFTIISAILFYASVFVTEKKLGKKLKSSEKRTLLLFSICAIFLLLDSTRFYVRFDFTKGNKYSISKYSKELADEATENINISYFQSKSLANYYPQVRDISDILKEYSQKKQISLAILNADKIENAKQLESYGLYANQIPVIGNNKTEYLNVYSAIILEYEDKTEIIPFILSSNTLEYDIDTKIISLLSEKKRIANILVANGMSLQNDYGYVTPWLNSNGIIVNEISLQKPLSAQLERSSVLLIFGSDKLTLEQCSEIIGYIEKGNSVLFAVSPYNADIENSWYITKPENQNLIEVLRSYGFDFSENLIADLSCQRILMQSDQNADGSKAEQTYSQQINYPLWISVMPQKNAIQGLTEYWPAELISSEKTEPLLFTSPLSWAVEPDNLSSEKLFETNPFVLEKATIPEAKTTKAAALISKNKKLVLIPDQYFANSLMIGYTGGEYGDYRNLDFLVNQILKLNGEEELSKIQENSTLTGNTSLFKTYNEELFNSAKQRTIICIFVIIPLLIIAFAIWFNLCKCKLLTRKLNEK